MTIPDSLQTLKKYVFVDYTKLVPASIDISPTGDDEGPVNVTTLVVAYLRDQQRIAAELASKLTAPLEKIIAKRDEELAALKVMVAALSLENAELKTKIVSTTPPPLRLTISWRRTISGGT
ncbi:hypothetical protein TL16_g01390 [Triparma laevis f. inornata]|uniref:Uncharacterized protein n=2 Tax=Triparma laevis TaxID=1534972 RepID=A0A9W7DRF5_9STRA|nr:hypothetical protein TL16_g01390 [Triparma laevis f. inornata]GMH53479.1 hypothetical protein TrLO_g186 [Triparma laevis f. longispina]